MSSSANGMLKMLMRGSRLRTPLSLLATSAAITLGALVPVPAIRAVLVLPLALVMPGYGLLAALGIRGRLDTVPTLALSVLLSIAIYPLLGLTLYAASIRLSTASVVAVTDALLLLLAATLALSIRGAGAGAPGSGPSSEPSTAWDGARGAVLFVAVVALALAALAAAMRSLPARADVPYTQLYLAGRWARVATVVEAHPRRDVVVRVGIANRTDRREKYRLVPVVDRHIRWRPRRVTLEPGDRWVGAVSGRVPATSCVHRLTIRLYRHGSPAALANLNLWVRGASDSDSICAT